MEAAKEQVTQILGALQPGDALGAEQLLPLVYHELRQLATVRMAQEAPGQTLQPTALVHEAWLRLVASPQRNWTSRGHFFAAAAEAMRRILIERARRRKTAKRGGGSHPVDLDKVDVAASADDELLLRIDEAVDKLALQEPEAARLVKLRFFIGLDYAAAARTLGISERTAKRYWTFARAWLYRELTRTG